MKNNRLLTRREFMQFITATTILVPLSSLAHKRLNAAAVKISLEEPWLTIDAVQQHLFPPTETSPGSQDIKALSYLQKILQAPDVSEQQREFISNGVDWLNDLANQHFSKIFIQLDSASREQLLRTIENSNAGERWLSRLLTYLIEALLSDPVYGGNPNGIGWAWLQHQPGYPSPPENKQYFKLDKKRYRSIKA